MNHKKFIILSCSILAVSIFTGIFFIYNFLSSNSIASNNGKIINGKAGDVFNFKNVSVKILDGISLSDGDSTSVEYEKVELSKNTYMSKIVLSQANGYWQLYFNNSQSNKNYTTITITKDKADGEVVGIYKISGGHNYCIYNTESFFSGTYYIGFVSSNDSLSGSVKYILTDNTMF